MARALTQNTAVLSPCLTSRAGTLCGRASGRAGVNECRTVLVIIDLLKVDNELAGIVLSICEDFGAKEGDDMIDDDLARFVGEVCVVDAETGVEPVNLTANKFLRDEALDAMGKSLALRADQGSWLTLAATSVSTNARCSSFPLKTGVV